MGLFGRSNKAGVHGPSSDSSTPDGLVFDHNAEDVETVKRNEKLDDSKVPFLTFRTFVMAILASMGGFIFGYDTGQISGFLTMDVFLQRFGEVDSSGTPFFTDVRSGLIVGLLSLGTLVGCLIAAPVSNRFGRRFCIPFWCLVFCLGVTIQIAVQSGQWVGIVMGRWVAGLGVGALSVLVPLYVSESAPKHIRGAAVCSYQLFITLGIFVADCINFGTEARTDTGSYRIPMGVGYIWAVILGVGMLFMPESPRWDIRYGHNERAFETMTRFYGVSRNHRAVAVETVEINQNIKASSGNHPWWEVFTGPRMMYRTFLAMSLQCFQQLTGANYFFYFGTTIFKGVGIQNSYVTAMILGGVNFGSTFLGLYLVEKYGRRRCLTGGALWMFFCFIIFASVGHWDFEPKQGSPDAKSPGTVMIVFACLFILAFASTWGPMIWAAIGEMFPYRYRADAMALATASNWTWNFAIAFATPFIVTSIDFLYGFVFAGCNLVAAGIVYFFLIESSGKTIEEIDTMYLLHVPPRESSKWTKEMIDAELLNTDNLYLTKGGRNIQKRNEADREAAEQEEGGMVAQSQQPADVTVVNSATHPVMSSGGA